MHVFGWNKKSYLTGSYIIITLKMKYLSKNTILGLKMNVKSGLEKLFWSHSMQEDSYTEFVILGTFMK